MSVFVLGVQVGDTVTMAIENMVVLWTSVMVDCFVIVMILMSVVVVTLVTVSVEVEVLVTICVLLIVCVLVIACVSVTVDVWVVGVALAQKLLRNMSTSSSHQSPLQTVQDHYNSSIRVRYYILQ